MYHEPTIPLDHIMSGGRVLENIDQFVFRLVRVLPSSAHISSFSDTPPGFEYA
jgi:hypothetical protein